MCDRLKFLLWRLYVITLYLIYKLSLYLFRWWYKRGIKSLSKPVTCLWCINMHWPFILLLLLVTVPFITVCHSSSLRCWWWRQKCWIWLRWCDPRCCMHAMWIWPTGMSWAVVHLTSLHDSLGLDELSWGHVSGPLMQADSGWSFKGYLGYGISQWEMT